VKVAAPSPKVELRARLWREMKAGVPANMLPRSDFSAFEQLK
jgi:hypothetical protein